MSWRTSDRRKRLPADWNAIRTRALVRDFYVCQLKFQGCLTKATDVDHKVAGDDHRLSNLQSACSKCHAFKSSLEGNHKLKQMRAKKKRPSDRHPGSR